MGERYYFDSREEAISAKDKFLRLMYDQEYVREDQAKAIFGEPWAPVDRQYVWYTTGPVVVSKCLDKKDKWELSIQLSPVKRKLPADRLKGVDI